MKHNNSIIFTTDLRNIKDSSEAWRVGVELFNATHDNKYNVLDKAALFEFLNMAADLQDENGYIVLFKDEYMPHDARVDIIYKPTYAVTYIAIYTYCCYCNDFDERLKTFIKKLLNLMTDIKGHGFEAADTVLETMEIFSRDYVKRIIDECPKMSASLKEMINKYLVEFKAALTSGEKITHGFDSTPKNSRIQQVVSYWDGKTKPVFVYGTLLKGERANHLLADADYCGKFALQNCAMFNLGSFPGLKRRKGEQIIGEVYFVSEETLDALDKYEGEGTLYNRTMAQAVNPSLTVVCYCYLYRGEVDESDIMVKPWNAKKNDYVWYAAYGSNISEERFNYYIKGGMCSSNGVPYNGCSDKSDWLETKTQKFKGRMYFGNESQSWGGKGVAFYDKNGDIEVQMKLYKITRGQLDDIRLQEGPSDMWYGNMVFLGLDDDGTEIYTLTSKERHLHNEPSAEYFALIKNALQKHCGYDAKSALLYLESCKIEL